MEDKTVQTQQILQDAQAKSLSRYEVMQQLANIGLSQTEIDDTMLAYEAHQNATDTTAKDQLKEELDSELQSADAQLRDDQIRESRHYKF